MWSQYSSKHLDRQDWRASRPNDPAMCPNATGRLVSEQAIACDLACQKRPRSTLLDFSAVRIGSVRDGQLIVRFLAKADMMSASRGLLQYDQLCRFAPLPIRFPIVAPAEDIEKL